MSEGVKEISVIAQDTTRYGTDLADYSLAKLLSNLAKIEGLVSLRVLYLYPDEITDELLEVIKNEPKLAKYFDIPIQHASSRLLKEMNRRGDEVFLQNLLDKIRTMIPDAIIRTTLIVGFPGETEEDFEILKAFVKRNRFERLGVFTYSDEENTKAHHMKNKVPEEIAKKDATKSCKSNRKLLRPSTNRVFAKPKPSSSTNISRPKNGIWLEVIKKPWTILTASYMWKPTKPLRSANITRSK